MEALGIGLFVLLFGAILTGHSVDLVHITPVPQAPRIQQVQPTPVTPRSTPPTARYYTPDRP